MTGLSELEVAANLIGGPDLYQNIERPKAGNPIDRLPKNDKGFPHDSSIREQAEKLGFVFGDEIDELFVAVTAPAGWSFQSTEHHMYSHLVDDKGRVRGQMCYKAAFYDRDAFYSLYSRYHVELKRPEDWFQRLYPKQPEPVYVTRRRTVTLRPGDEGYEEHAPWWREHERYGFHPAPVKVTKEIRVLAAPDKQPSLVPSQGFDEAVGAFDRQCGEFVFVGETYRHPAQGERGPGGLLAQEEIEKAARGTAIAWLDTNFPQWRDPCAYWD